MKSNKLFKPLLFVILIALLFGCAKEEDIKVIYGDAIVRSFNRGDSIVYGLCYFVYAYDLMKEVTVRKQSATTEIQLDSTENRYTFSLLADSSEYKTKKPDAGRYVFKAVFDNGYQIEAEDYLDSTVVKPPVITKYVFDTVDIKFNLEWKSVTYAQQYRILLENENKQVVFQSNFLSSSQLNMAITSFTDGWLTNKIPQGGEKYRAYIIAYQYEDVATVFDLQSISFTEGDYFKWIIYND